MIEEKYVQNEETHQMMKERIQKRRERGEKGERGERKRTEKTEKMEREKTRTRTHTLLLIMASLLVAWLCLMWATMLPQQRNLGHDLIS